MGRNLLDGGEYLTIRLAKFAENDPISAHQQK